MSQTGMAIEATGDPVWFGHWPVLFEPGRTTAANKTWNIGQEIEQLLFKAVVSRFVQEVLPGS